MLQRFRAAIFDLDDTLFDCTGMLVHAARRRAALELVKAGLPMTAEQAVALQQQLADEFGPHCPVFDEIGRRYKIDNVALDAAYRAYNADEVTDIAPFPDVVPTLRFLRGQGVLCILLTSGHYRRQQAKIHKLGLEGEFDEILINDLDRGSTLVECFRYLLQRYNLDPEAVLTVGDRPGEEVRIGNQLGLTTVRMLSGRFKTAEPRDEFEAANYKIAHIFQIPTIIQLAQRGKPPQNLRIVAVGGGTGLPVAVEGCKTYSQRLTAIVAVTDNGRSSGKIRADFGMLAPGDVRNCLVALSEQGQKKTELNELFQYRFNTGSFKGMSLGNLILAAMTDMAGSFDKGIRVVSHLLNIQGKVLPATVTDCHVGAELEDGTRVLGEVNVRRVGKPAIRRVFLTPENPRALEEAVAEIMSADIIVIGPGSLFTSVIPNLLVPDLRAAIASSSASKYYVCNIVTQPGQTDGLDAFGHVRALEQHLGEGIIDCMLLNSSRPDTQTMQRYREQGAEMVGIESALGGLKQKVSQADLIEDVHMPRILWEKDDLLRHDPDKLGDAICRTYCGLEPYDPRRP